MRLPTVSLLGFKRIAAATVGGYALLVVTGGAVRLTDSGLGCPDWPSCYQNQLTPQLSLHPEVEFANRLVTVAISVLSIVVILAALRLTVARRDLVALSGGILAGLVAQIVLGGLVVLFKLNPYLVALHFVLTLAVLGVAIVLYHRATGPPTRAVSLVEGPLRWLSRIVLGALTGLICLGTIVTGAGPHAGASNAKRIPIAFRDIAEAHSTVALFVIGLVLATLFALRVGGAPLVAQRRARLLFEVLALQGVLGYTQYFLHDAAGVIEVHLAGATAAWCTALAFYLALHEHPVPSGDRDAPAGLDADLAGAR